MDQFTSQKEHGDRAVRRRGIRDPRHQRRERLPDTNNSTAWKGHLRSCASQSRVYWKRVVQKELHRSTTGGVSTGHWDPTSLIPARLAWPCLKDHPEAWCFSGSNSITEADDNHTPALSTHSSHTGTCCVHATPPSPTIVVDLGYMVREQLKQDNRARKHARGKAAMAAASAGPSDFPMGGGMQHMSNGKRKALRASLRAALHADIDGLQASGATASEAAAAPTPTARNLDLELETALLHPIHEGAAAAGNSASVPRDGTTLPPAGYSRSSSSTSSGSSAFAVAAAEAAIAAAAQVAAAEPPAGHTAQGTTAGPLDSNAATKAPAIVSTAAPDAAATATKCDVTRVTTAVSMPAPAPPPPSPAGIATVPTDTTPDKVTLRSVSAVPTPRPLYAPPPSLQASVSPPSSPTPAASAAAAATATAGVGAVADAVSAACSAVVHMAGQQHPTSTELLVRALLVDGAGEGAGSGSPSAPATSTSSAVLPDGDDSAVVEEGEHEQQDGGQCCNANVADMDSAQGGVGKKGMEEGPTVGAAVAGMLRGAFGWMFGAKAAAPAAVLQPAAVLAEAGPALVPTTDGPPSGIAAAAPEPATAATAGKAEVAAAPVEEGPPLAAGGMALHGPGAGAGGGAKEGDGDGWVVL